MNITLIEAYFAPEVFAFTHLEQDILQGLVKAGHTVRVVCPTPTRGVSKETVKAYKKIRHESYGGIEVSRYWAPQERSNPVARAFRYFWCNFRGNHLAKKYRDTDVILAVSTPPTQGWSAGRLAKKMNVPFVYSLQDLFPESLVTSGICSAHSPFYKIGEWIEKKTYPLCSRIIVLSRTVENMLIKKGVNHDKLKLISNWVDPDVVNTVPENENALFDEYHISKDTFNVVYAGNLGASQGPKVIYRAARLLKDNKDISFTIFGGGSGYHQMQHKIKEYHLSNVKAYPLLPVERVPEVYSLGDVALVTCKKGVSQTAMPSKTWNIMACNTPIIASFDTDSELAHILHTAKAGVCVEPENPEALANAIVYAKDHAGKKNKGEAREFVMAHMSRNIGVKKYVRCIETAKRKG